MLERLVSTGSGFPTVYVGNQALHSRYNPVSEAEKYIDSLHFREEVRFFILLEPGLGYTAAVLQKKFPGAAILALHVSDFFVSRKNYSDAIPVWSPGSGRALLDFLEDHIPDTEAASVALVEWRPSRTAFGKAYLRVFAETVEHLKRADANKRTTKAFGKRWFKNVFKNLALLQQAPLYRPFAAPLVIAAAGPSLEEVIPRLAERKKKSPLFILAVSSAAPALLAADLPPDLTISSDGGNWALLHLYETLRKPCSAFAAALSAALPSQFADRPWLPISDGSLWQNTLLRSMGLPFVSFPQRGTVTAAALDLAFLLCRGRVYIAGTDLDNRDIQTHVRPYSFERLLTEKATRLNPAYSQHFFRSSALASSGSQGIYAQWFARQRASYPDHLFSLGNNNAVFNQRSADLLSQDSGDEEPKPAEIVSLKDRRAVERALETLLAALDLEGAGKTILDELSPLLFPQGGVGERESMKEAAREAIRAAFAGGASRG
ncbi:MAG: DUF115 domain-containing protein [Treponema sp.]|jgi:hypothetical protein|nr:DUF115 domain-containing protein [Treponema sp.]